MPRRQDELLRYRKAAQELAFEPIMDEDTATQDHLQKEKIKLKEELSSNQKTLDNKKQFLETLKNQQTRLVTQLESKRKEIIQVEEKKELLQEQNEKRQHSRALTLSKLRKQQYKTSIYYEKQFLIKINQDQLKQLQEELHQLQLDLNQLILSQKTNTQQIKETEIEIQIIQALLLTKTRKIEKINATLKSLTQPKEQNDSALNTVEPEGDITVSMLPNKPLFNKRDPNPNTDMSPPIREQSDNTTTSDSELPKPQIVSEIIPARKSSPPVGLKTMPQQSSAPLEGDPDDLWEVLKSYYETKELSTPNADEGPKTTKHSQRMRDALIAAVKILEEEDPKHTENTSSSPAPQLTEPERQPPDIRRLRGKKYS